MAELSDKNNSPIYVVSGGVGSSGEQVVHTVLAQFPGIQVAVDIFSHVLNDEQIKTIVDKAFNAKAVIVHTLVNPHLRNLLIRESKNRNVLAVDIMGDLLEVLTNTFGVEPLCQPGLYRKQKQEYFDRVAAIEYTIAHDDGKRTDDIDKADIVLLGLSRSGKTPLSMYLSVMGWKVANVPIVMGIPVPEKVFEIDKRRVIGISITATQLLTHRRKRLEKLGVKDEFSYIESSEINREIANAQNVFIKGDFITVSMSGKPIETCASEIIEIITKNFKSDYWKI